MLKRFVQRALDLMTKNTVTEEAAKSSLDKVHDGRIEKSSREEKQKRPKNVRYSMLLAYQGKNYYGMQVLLSEALYS